jgi:hypothetical protein
VIPKDCEVDLLPEYSQAFRLGDVFSVEQLKRNNVFYYPVSKNGDINRSFPSLDAFFVSWHGTTVSITALQFTVSTHRPVGELGPLRDFAKHFELLASSVVRRWVFLVPPAAFLAFKTSPHSSKIRTEVWYLDAKDGDSVWPPGVGKRPSSVFKI